MHVLPVIPFLQCLRPATVAPGIDCQFETLMEEAHQDLVDKVNEAGYITEQISLEIWSSSMIGGRGDLASLQAEFNATRLRDLWHWPNNLLQRNAQIP